MSTVPVSFLSMCSTGPVCVRNAVIGHSVAAATQSKLITKEHHISIPCSGGERSKEEGIEYSATGQ